MKMKWTCCLFLFTLLIFSSNALFSQSTKELIHARLDPIVDPGTCSNHVHAVAGASSFGAIVSAADGDFSEDVATTARIVENKSIYWVPTLYVMERINETLTKYHLVHVSPVIYYRDPKRGVDRADVNPFPMGLRLFVGNPGCREQSCCTDNNWNIRWTLGPKNRGSTNRNDHASWDYMKNESVGRYIEMNVNFPECLAVNSCGEPITDSPDHTSHAAYRVNRTSCPESHPYQIIRVNGEFRYQLDSLDHKLPPSLTRDPSNWILSTNDTTGCSKHADFISGWPVPFFRRVIDSCFGNDPQSLPGKNCPVIRLQPQYASMTKPVPIERLSPVHQLPSGSDPCIIKERSTLDMKYDFIGCYNEVRGRRAMYRPIRGRFSANGCVDKCLELGTRYASISGRRKNDCFCGLDYDIYGPAAEDACNEGSSNDSDEIVMQVYSTGIPGHQY